ncbi:MAG: hypothetical protein AB7G11_16085 [Phycisphaerales bacterium]
MEPESRPIVVIHEGIPRMLDADARHAERVALDADAQARQDQADADRRRGRNPYMKDEIPPGVKVRRVAFGERR